jgi:hypothetical protein
MDNEVVTSGQSTLPVYDVSSTLVPAPKPRTFRLKDCHCADTKSDLEAVLQVSIDRICPGALIVKQISIAKYDARRSCATVTFDRDPPRELQQEYKMDRDFIGFTPLVDKGDTRLDIIAIPGLGIPGLGNNAIGTFESTESNDVWLRDWLNVPDARVLVYGYDAELEGSLSWASLENLAKMFLYSLVSFLEDTETMTQNRPLIFIAHSFGGLVIKQALVLALQEQHHRLLYGNPEAIAFRILLSTTALLFFGVPNMGMSSQHLTKLVKGKPNESLVRDLQTNSNREPSQFLRQLSQRFKECVETHQPHFNIVAFFEMKESNTIERLANGRLVMTGPPQMLVTQDSACNIGLGNNFYQEIPLPRDHMGLVKFDDEWDPGFGVVRRAIKEQAQEANRIVGERYKNRDGASSK